MGDNQKDLDKPLTMEDIQAKSEAFAGSLLSQDGKDKDKYTFDLNAPTVNNYLGVVFSIEPLDKEQVIPVKGLTTHKSNKIKKVDTLTPPKSRPEGNGILNALGHGIEFGFFPDGSVTTIWLSDVKIPKISNPFNKIYNKVFKKKRMDISPQASDALKAPYKHNFSPLFKYYPEEGTYAVGMLFPTLPIGADKTGRLNDFFDKNKNKILENFLHSPGGAHLDPKIVEWAKHQVVLEAGASLFSSVTVKTEPIGEDGTKRTAAVSNGIEGTFTPIKIKLPDQFSVMKEKDKDGSKHSASKSLNAAFVDMFKNNLRKLYKNEIQEAKKTLDFVLDNGMRGGKMAFDALAKPNSLAGLAAIGVKKLTLWEGKKITKESRKEFVKEVEQAMKEAVDDEINEKFSGRELEIELTVGALMSNSCSVSAKMEKMFEPPKILPEKVQVGVDALKIVAEGIKKTKKTAKEVAEGAGEIVYRGIVADDIINYTNNACDDVGAAMHSNDISQRCVKSVKTQTAGMEVVGKEAIDFSIRKFQATLPTVKSDTVLSDKEKYEKEQDAATEKYQDMLSAVATDDTRDNADTTEADNTELSVGH